VRLATPLINAIQKKINATNPTELPGRFCTGSDAIFAQQTSGTSCHTPPASISSVGLSGTRLFVGGVGNFTSTPLGTFKRRFLQN